MDKKNLPGCQQGGFVSTRFYGYLLRCLIADWAAARRAMGTLKGEHDT